MEELVERSQGGQREKPMTIELFKQQQRHRRKQQLLKSPFWTKNEVSSTSDLCSEGFHRSCPRASTITLLDITFVCNCPCHEKRKNRGRAGVAATDSRFSRPTISRSRLPSRVRTHPKNHQGALTYNG
jgi:hypothetical protein